MTKGALAGLVGRLNGVNYEYGEVVYRTGCRTHAEHRSVWIAYEDLVISGHTTHIDECHHQPCCCLEAPPKEHCPLSEPHAPYDKHVIGSKGACSACIRYRNQQERVPKHQHCALGGEVVY